MSKAFLKENESSLELDLTQEDDPEGAEEKEKIPTGSKNYITPLGARKLQQELSHLLTVLRPEVVRTVSWAASNGDRSENGDYIYGKKRLREIDRRIRFLSKRLDKAEIIDPEKQKGDRVLFGATIELLDLENEALPPKTYAIVGIDEANVKHGRISWISPLARALLQNQRGDTITFRSPQGEREFEIVSVRFLPLPDLTD